MNLTSFLPQIDHLTDECLQILLTCIVYKNLKVALKFNFLIDDFHSLQYGALHLRVELNCDFAFLDELFVDGLELLNWEPEHLIVSLPSNHQ